MFTQPSDPASFQTNRKAYNKAMRHQTPSMQGLLRHFEIHNCEILVPRDFRDLDVMGLATVVSPTSDKYVGIYEESLVSLETPVFVVHFYTGDEPIPANEQESIESAKKEIHGGILDAYTSIVKWFYSKS